MPIELLAPAGSPEALDAAVGEGADAVYLGLKTFNARLRSANFTYARFEAALRAFRRMGKRIYVAVNTVFEQREADRVYQLLRYLSAMGPDALIVQDLGVVAMARSQFPGLKLHASTQMNVASGRGCNALSRHGVSRVVLARELSLDELRSVRSETNVELEVFVHGALCVGASGLCLFSSFLGGKSANRGMCTQACRRLYHRGGTESDGLESGYYFSPADLQLLEHLPALADAGINAVKIEGRMKSAEYVGAVVSAYRLVLDAIAESGGGDDDRVRQSIEKGRGILRGDFARSKTTFYFNADFPAGTGGGVDWLNPVQDGGTGISLGALRRVQGRDGERLGFVRTANSPPAMGDSIRLHKSDDSARVSHKLQHVEAAKGGDGYWISIPDGFDLGDRVYLIQTRARRYRPVTPADAKGSRGPGHDKAPVPLVVIGAKHTGGSSPKNKKDRPSAGFPEGLYVAVSRTEDLYVVQSSRPAKVILDLNRKTAGHLLERAEPLPFKPADLILSLDPYFPQATAQALADEIPGLVDLGYRQFVANNPGHFPLFKDVRPEIRIVAGPWLYMFNTWAMSFVASLGVDGFVSPLENNRQNLERTLGPDGRRSLKDRVFVPVFAWPPLFHIRANLARQYDFKAFSDSRDENFLLAGGPEGSRVFPAKPFSITDKISFLQDSGFRRFIVDLSGLPLRKTDYKDLMRAISQGAPLPRMSRFNWKDGFFTEEQRDRPPRQQPTA
ncbi:MAG: U32 family peptidase [Treponema sp.]|nr:U32 family peptidase [Treponema sp.]